MEGVIYLSTLGERIRFAREQKGLLQSDLAKLINVKSSGVISNWEKDLNKPDADKIVRLCSVLDVSASFLLDYYGKVEIDELNSIETSHIKKYRDLDSHGKEVVDFLLNKEYERCTAAAPSAIVPMRMIQYYQKLASAGDGQIVFDDVPVDLIEIPDVPEYRRVKYAVGVNGRSMEPLYHDGDILLVQPAEDVEIGEIGIFIVDGQSYVKRRQKDFLESVNPEFANIALSEGATCLGLVVDHLMID